MELSRFYTKNGIAVCHQQCYAAGMRQLDPTREEETLVVTETGLSRRREIVLREHPFELALNEILIGSTMVLPTDLEALAVGFLFARGYIESFREVVEILICPEGRLTVYARVDDPTPERSEEMIITSGCGGSGRISREMLQAGPGPLGECRMDFSEIRELIRGTLQISDLSRTTHCVHACGFASRNGIEACCEDVGRHNAVDKVIGTLLQNDLCPEGAMFTTGRLTSDIVLKCARIGIPILISRTAPSSLGIDIARRTGITLVGYARLNRLNIFHRPDRIIQTRDQKTKHKEENTDEDLSGQR